MTLQFSTAVRNAELDSIETTIGTSPSLIFFDGAMPVDCATADAGTTLATLTLPSDWMNAASGGQKTLNGTWSGTASAAGMARYWRMKTSGGTCSMQGPAAMDWPASSPVYLNQQVLNNGNVYKCITAGTTASSGGPSGTGTDITDGTAHWAYVDVSTGAIVLTNDNIANGQSISITTFTLTAGNS